MPISVWEVGVVGGTRRREDEEGEIQSYCSVLVDDDHDCLLPLLTLAQKPHHCMELESLNLHVHVRSWILCTTAGTATIPTTQLCECGEDAEDHVSSHSASLRSNSQQTARGG